MRCEAQLTKDYLRTSRDRQNDGRCRRIADWIFEDCALCGEHVAIRLRERAKADGTIKVLNRKLGEREYRIVI